MLTPEHVQVLTRARALLQRLDEDTLKNVGYRHGKFGEACEAAEKAIFNVLILARHWMEAEISDDDIHGRKEIEE